MSVELRPVPRAADTPTTDDEEGNTLAQSLPPTDQGPEAWKFLFASFVIEAVLWGFPLTFGVFQEYYSAQPQFSGNSDIAVIGTVSTSIYFLLAPLAAPLVRRFNAWQRHMVVAGWAICVASLVGASFSDSVPGLIATQGALYGFGFLMLYFPVLRMINEWFVRRRGFAYGVLYAGGGVSGVGMPFLLQLLLSRYGYRTTLRAVAVAQFALVAPVLPLLKGRLPPSGRAALRVLDVDYLRQPLFYCFALSNLLQGFGYYIPSLYLPSYASTIGLSGTMGALLLAAHNLATVFGQLGFGWMLDRFNNVFALMFVSSFVSAVAALAIWGFAHSLETLLVFALAFGMFASAFQVLWPKFGSMLSDDPQSVYSIMAFGKGVGNLATGPITAGLLRSQVSSGYGAGRYQSVILFLGSFMLCASLGVFGWPLKKTALRV
ncbi:MFS transporter asaE [Colletotrichum trifolii]|uniref:MFS transporter asaE n=1 Tax=Colletotrichum trifolii TaxID=5466 RepID=A0A4V3HW33_COLTR|nr:MFS transporter asaE [Colletotrichum trifolii]